MTQNTLVTKLFDESSYNKLVQPDKLVNVNAGYNLISVNSLEWQDDRLKWNISAGGINYIYVPEDKVWHPDLIVLNLVNPLDKNLGAERPVKIESSGLLIWKQIAILSTFCSVNVLFFPFDRHICQLQLASLDLSVDDIQLEFSTEPVTTPLLQEGWQILTSTYSGLLTTSTSFDWNYMLTFNIEVQRYPGHYIMIIIFPTVLTALLSFVTFCLPLKSGVRIGYISTVVLALVFILTLFADTMPSSTRSPSILGKVTIIMVMCTCLYLMMSFSYLNQISKSLLNVI
ncbi:unnamed protein product [Mytilus edulis]|uniref:Neurotransmitter-gated ion-channel ligand-binding domain-containing protein n=1 Tax=Mytilus edulis TaxID=6550 RepID=A0A8S3URW9_MYTED|nr:unnamed protein product [Mytilus edulis]